MSLNANEMGQAMYDHVAEGKNPDATTKSLAEDSMKKMAAGIVEHLEGNLEIYHDSTLDGTGSEDDPLTVVGGSGMLTEVTHDTTLSGLGTTGSPLTVLDSPHADAADSATNVSGIVAIANGGTGQDSASGAFDALSPLTTSGDLLVGGVSGTGSRLGIGVTGQVLTVESGIPTWRAAPGASTNALGVYFSNNELEANVTGWTTYADTAGTTPVDGTGGSPNVTFTYNSTNPLLQLGDGLFSKDANNRQGQGVSYNFSIDRGIANGTTLQLSFLYKTSTNFALGDMGVYIYDVTNNVLITPTLVNIEPNSTCGNFNAFFTTSNSLSYRFILHVASTNATSYTLNIDHITIKPSTIYNASAVGNWTSFSPSTITNMPGSWTKAKWRRVGSSIELDMQYALSGVVTGLPALNIDSAILASLGLSSISATPAMFKLTAVNSGIAYYSGTYDGNNFWKSDYTSTYLWTASTPHTWKSGDFVFICASVPISQWTSNINLATDFTEYASNSGMGDSSDTGNFAYGIDGSSFPTGTYTTYHNKYVRFTREIQPTDSIIVEMKYGSTGIWQPVGPCAGVSFTYGSGGAAGIGYYTKVDSKTISIIFGQYAYGTTNWYSTTDLQNSRWRVRKVSNGNMAEIPTIVRAEYTTTAGNSVPNGNWGLTDYATKIEDTHNAVTTGASWKFTAPIAGIYEAKMHMLTATVSAGFSACQLYKNGSVYRVMFRTDTPAYSGPHGGHGSINIRLNAGDYIDFRLICSASTTLDTTAAYNWIEITWMGK